MKNPIKSFMEASVETKLFVVSVASLAVILVVTLVFIYGRLDYTRSYDSSTKKEQTQQ